MNASRVPEAFSKLQSEGREVSTYPLVLGVSPRGAREAADTTPPGRLRRGAGSGPVRPGGAAPTHQGVQASPFPKVWSVDRHEVGRKILESKKVQHLNRAPHKTAPKSLSPPSSETFNTLIHI